MHVVLANFTGLNAFGIITSKKIIPVETNCCQY
jgi:hypothetical protein